MKFEDRKNASLPTLIAGVLLCLPAVVGLLFFKVPTGAFPFPALTVLPAFALSLFALWPVAILTPPFIFFIWNPALFRGEGKVPRRSLWLLAAAIALSFVWFCVGWKDGVQFQGRTYVHVAAIGNIVWALLLALMFARYMKHESFKTNLFLHWILFLWLAWYAFPYLGELP